MDVYFSLGLGGEFPVSHLQGAGGPDLTGFLLFTLTKSLKTPSMVRRGMQGSEAPLSWHLVMSTSFVLCQVNYISKSPLFFGPMKLKLLLSP
jgi:hypothetical protein